SADAPGLRLSGIPRGGPVAALGLRSADVLEAIEGSVVWTPDDGTTQLKAALMAVLESDRPATFRVRRRGEPIVWSCHVKKRSDESGARRP
ncbi:MAG: hypothetical protein VX000_08405, partial [Myxococcota bacterium]|nr:hypothetical protein [Myxococcota bacterium]